MPSDTEFRDMTARFFVDACRIGESMFKDDQDEAFLLTDKPIVVSPSSAAMYVLLPRGDHDPLCVRAGKQINARLRTPPPQVTLKDAGRKEMLERIIEVADDLDNSCSTDSPEEFAAQSLKRAAYACLRHLENEDYDLS